jgi:hypothetical protein
MKIVFRTVIFHVSCIIGFGILYFYLKDDFTEKEDVQLEIIDYLLLSTTIQAGVGISELYPTSFYGKVAMIIQQLIMLSTHIFTIYILNV